MTNFSKAASAIITVGAGRGFVVGGHVITAAHCLPFFPPCMSASNTEERTYESLLAPLGGEPRVWAECLFVDPIGDIAVLGTPDGQELWAEASSWSGLVESESVTPLSIAKPGEEGWLLSLDGVWFRCSVQCQECGPLWLSDLEGRIVGGMSGSPVISAAGAAIGIVCVSAESSSGQSMHHGPNPSLTRNLPGWFLRESA
jgi:hypothetical protein